ncbi:hypothetical protein BGZ61DRAFT_438936 [Ilyonectria robusta]|uniref:uncharacterized protein n=1 Tax=Ilyonectria robusta TaxID=1079257 RepID=UPI001E8CFF41|nr:uncharacterized protein BGZ61DRAFT_438936 [Ilyonectria robusta]KAH8737752.1 hypothetical protein BGZ61DRAFT_438936 [Ilyonectria robusta]
MEEGYIVDPPSGTQDAPAEKPSTRRKAVRRRDPDKRRLQNRMAQKTYREKQKKRIQELELLAEGSNSVNVPSNDQQGVVEPSSSSVDITGQASLEVSTINPSQLQPSTTSSVTFSTTPSEEVEGAGETWDQDILSPEFDQWLAEAYPVDPSVPPVVFFNCGCPILHIGVHLSSVLLPVIPDLRMNTLRIDIMCSLGALLENCLQVGITQRMYCAEDSVSPFYRPQIEDPAERADFVESVQRGFRGLHFDLRPTRKQIVTNHHPFLDAIPFTDIRDNLIAYADEIDEDEFFHDSLNHMTCWGSVKGAHTGSPWDSRSWEASELFLQRWELIVGGEDGQLTRQSRWWRSLRGERVTEIS